MGVALATGFLATADADDAVYGKRESATVAYRSVLPAALPQAAEQGTKRQTDTRREEKRKVSAVTSDRENLLAAIEREAFTRSKLETEFMDQLRASLPRGGEGIVFGQLQLPGRLKVPQTAWDVRFEYRLPQQGIGRVLGRGTMTAQGRPVTHFTGSVVMDRETRGLQVNRIIRRGAAIEPTDLEVLETTLSQLPPDALTGREIADGARARAELRPGAWLTGRMIETPKLVKRRQLVTLKLINGQIEITSKGVAMEDGRAGEVIRATNVSSGREVFGRVIGGDLLEVIF